jgi:hypothetical protein
MTIMWITVLILANIYALYWLARAFLNAHQHHKQALLNKLGSIFGCCGPRKHLQKGSPAGKGRQPPSVSFASPISTYGHQPSDEFAKGANQQLLNRTWTPPNRRLSCCHYQLKRSHGNALVTMKRSILQVACIRSCSNGATWAPPCLVRENPRSYYRYETVCEVAGDASLNSEFIASL